MSRFLFVVPPLTGHINPTVSVGAELAARGHDIAWAGFPGTLGPLLPDGARIFPVVDETHWTNVRGAAALKFFWEDFLIPLARTTLPATRAVIEQFAPDVVVADQQALAGAVAARQAGVTWVTSATTPGEIARPLVAMPKVEEWIVAQMTAFQREAGITDPVDLRFSDRLVLAYTTPELFGDVSDLGGQYVFTGPALGGRPERAGFPWEWLDPGRRQLLVSLGTVNYPAGGEFFRAAVDALADLGDEVQAVFVSPPLDDGPVPPHLLFAGHVPQLALLPRMSAVVAHAGHNTVCESLAHGLPLVLTPIRDDQPMVANQVIDAGAGIRLRFGRLRADELQTAVRAVLSDPSYRTAAERIRDSFAAAGGSAAAADHLEKLL
jgi:MGT family glycosyltransferase